VWLGAALGVGALLGACGGSRDERVKGSFSARYSCDPNRITTRAEPGGMRVQGCGYVERYDCFREGCQPAEQLAKEQTGATMADEGRTVTELRLVVVLEDGNMLRFSAVPQERDVAEVSLDAFYGKDCDLDFMVDGELVDLSPGEAPHSRAISRDVMLELGSARQIAVRSCGKRWSLARRDIIELRRLVARYAEEVAWRGSPRQSGTGGHPAPVGGWRAWQALTAFPTAAPPEAVLSGTQLFGRLAPSMWRVECKLESGFVQGSAVAVTKSTLVTNCHVIEGALKIVVTQDKKERVAKVSASDPVKDRCVLEVAETDLVPVAGVRPYVDLKVGEPLYTLGAPSGLELSLANGILSALREDQGVRYVQTTAPISPGSSGGGLFDARGNLVGITTLVLAGKQHLNQSLNFAIAAEMYWTQ
jgi:hypothetical protein